MYAGLRQNPSSFYDFNVNVSDFGNSVCNKGNVIDDPIECKNALDSIKKFKYKDTFKNTTWDGLTNNAGAPYGCILYKKDTEKKYHLYFNTNKTNSKNNTNAKICKYRARNKYQSGMWGENSCNVGRENPGRRDLRAGRNDVESILRLQRRSGSRLEPVRMYRLPWVRERLPTVWFNKNTKNSGTWASNAPVCDLYPEFKSGDFVPDAQPIASDGRQGISAHFLDLVKEYKAKGHPVPILAFGNPATTTCMNDLSLTYPDPNKVSLRTF